MSTFTKKNTLALGEVTKRLFQSAERLKSLLTRDENSFSIEEYDNVNGYISALCDLLWENNSLYYLIRQQCCQSEEYVKEFLSFGKENHLDQDKPEFLGGIKLATIDNHIFHPKNFKFSNHEEYFGAVQATIRDINEPIERTEKVFVDAFITSLFGVHLPCYSDDSLVEKFGDKSEEITKIVEEIKNRTKKIYTSRKAYSTDGDIYSQNLLPDFSTEEKALEAAREWYLQKEPDQEKRKELSESPREQCLMYFVYKLSNLIYRAQMENYMNHASYDHYGSNDNKAIDYLKTDPSQLMVLMNSYDYMDLGLNFVDSPVSIMLNKKEGISFYGLPFILPGCAVVIDKSAFAIEEFYEGDFNVKKRLFVNEQAIFEVLCPAKGQKFVPNSIWIKDNGGLFKEENKTVDEQSK